jgi:3-hydroxyisobutyrate dehydrogenase-like beta-hydroxyacid dehydrogenase
LGEKAKEMYEKMVAIGYAKKDMSAVYDALVKHKL